jgi:hypothetical protein
MADEGDVPARHHDEPRYYFEQYGPQGPHIAMRCLNPLGQMSGGNRQVCCTAGHCLKGGKVTVIRPAFSGPDLNPMPDLGNRAKTLGR